MLRLKHLILFSLLLSWGPAFCQAADLVWTNTAGGNWDTAANWNPNQVPGSTDNAFITNRGTYAVTVNVNATVASLQAGGSSGSQTLSLSSSTLTLSGASLLNTNCAFTFSGGTLTGSGDVTVTGALTWTGGTMSGTGKTIIANGGTLNLSSGTHDLNRVLQNDGTATWTAGAVQMNGGTFNNHGSFTANSGSALSCYGTGGVNGFNNAGTFTKQGAGTASFTVSSTGVSFNNSVAVDVQGGTLALNAGGTNSSSILLAAGTTLGLSGSYSHAATSSISGSGTLSVTGGTHTFAAGAQVSAGLLNFSSGTVSFTGDLSFANVTFSSGTLTGSGDVTITGALNWTSGTMSGSGKTIVANGGTLSLSSGTHDLNRVLQNDGTATWTAGAVQMDGGTFNNNGSFTANSGSTLNCYGTGGVNAFNNAGTFTKQGGEVTAFFVSSTGVNFNNSGAVDVQGGTLALNAGGTHNNDFAVASGAILGLNNAHTFTAAADITGAGNLNVAGGTITDAGTVNVDGATFSSGTATFSSSFTGGSFLTVSGGTVNFNGTTTFAPGATLTFSSGTLSGSGDVTITGALNWTSGTMSGSGKTIVANGGTLNLSSGTHDLNRVLQNDGTATWTAGAVQMSGGTFNNNGSLTANSGSTLNCYGTGGVNAFNNAGTFTKQGDGVTTFFVSSTGVSFNNSGAVDVQGGTLGLDAGGTHNNDFVVASGAALRLNNTHTFTAGADITGAGNLNVAGGTITDAGTVNVSGATFSSGTATFNGSSFAVGGLAITGGTADISTSTPISVSGGTLSSGTLSGSGNVTITGTLNWTSGTMSGSGRTIIANDGTLNLSSSTHDLNRVLQNEGTATWTAGALQMSGGTFDNNGGFTANSGAALSCYGTGGVNAFNNAGTFTKQGGGVTTFFVSSTAVSFNNSGVVDMQGGTLTFNSGFTQTDGQMILSGGTVSANSTMQIQGGVLSGVGLISASVNSSGIISPGASPGLLTITGNYTQGTNGVLNVELAGTVPGTNFDQLAIGGAATLAGTLNVTFTNNFQPATNSSFTFLTCGSRSGSFGTFVYPSNTVGLQLTYSGTSATIQEATVQFTPTVYWVGGSGNWNTESNWNTGTLPGPNDDVLINVAGDVIVTHSSGSHSSKSLVSQNAFVLSGGLLTISNTIQVNNAFTLSGGTLRGATILPGTGGQGIVFSGSGGNYLDGVTVNGDLDLSNGGNVRVLNGLVLNGTAQLDNGGVLAFQGTQTFSTGRVVFTNGFLSIEGNTTLTLGPAVVVRGKNGSLGQARFQGGTQALINQGLISADVAGGTLTINAQTFINQGNVDAQKGTISLSGAYALAGGTLSLGITSLTDYGRINFSSPLTMQGTLKAQFDGFYRPPSGSSFTLLTYPSRTGTFDAFDLPTDVQWQTTNGATAFAITATALLESPSIAVGPQTQSIVVGSNATLNVTALGAQPLSYQWRLNGVNLTDDARMAGSQSDSLNLTNVRFSDAGGYRVVVTNAYGSITSSVATLTPLCIISASNYPAAAGTIVGTGLFAAGTTKVVTANPNFGYKFAYWTEGTSVLGTNASLATVLNTNHFFVANYQEANLLHVVTTATSPSGLATVAGSGPYTNDQSFAFSAPASVTNPPNLYNFHEWRANGAFVSGIASFNKTFSTLDPTNLQFVAHYDTVSILPLITNVTLNLAQPIPATTNFQLSLQFNRTMNTNFTPLVVITNSAGGAQPVVPPAGTWSAVSVSNDTFTPPPITFSPGMDGTNKVFVSLARDLGGEQLALTNLVQLRVDVTPPPNPALSLTASNSSSATLGWSGYAAPADLDGFRVFLATSNFTSVAGRVPVSAVGAGTRQFTYYSLSLDQPYYAAVAAVDVAGNSSPTVTPLGFSLPSSTPPPVPVQVQAVGPASAFVSWNSYDPTSLLGFAGFRLYNETNNFTSVSNLTPRQTLGPGARSVPIDNLNRTRTYYFAVVGFNGNNAFNSNVTTAAWSDPFAGSIGANVTIGGPGQNVDILQSITIVSNAVLTVPANTTLRFAPGTGLTVQQGALHADGTALDPIFFTSANDQPGLTPAAGDWAGVTLGSGAGASVLRHVFIKYDAGLTISNCAPTVEAFTALYNTGAGLNLLGTATVTTSDALLAFNDLGARQLNSAQLNLRNSVIKNNGTNAHATGSLSLVATQNWWGSAVASEIDAGLQGLVNRSSFLVSEPLLTPAIGTSNNLTQTGSRDVNLRLACRTAEAMRLSEDSTFTGVFYTPFTNAAAFQLSEGGGAKTVFAQFRSLTGQTSAPVNVTITYVTAGPALNAFSLTEGQRLNRPLLVTGSASAPLGMAAMEFYVDNVGQGTNAGGNFSQWFDVRNFSAAVHRVKLLARDTAGNFATLERNVAITPVPPPAPAITDPPSDIAVNTNAVRIAGTAEPFVEVCLFRSGTILGITNASAAGTFSFAHGPLVEGVNPLTALAIDALGSAGSPVRTVVRDTVPPAALILDPPVYTYGIGLRLTWHFPTTGKRANSFEVFWHTAPITNPNQASGHTLRTPGTQLTVQGLATANYYFYVVGYDDVGNASPLSAPVQFLYDGVPPAFTVTFDKPSPVGVGPLRVTLTSSKPVNGVPSTTVQPYGSAPALLTLTNTALNTFEGAINVTPLLPSGPVVLNVSAQDTAGNPFNGPPSGAALSIDVRPPAGAISTAPVPPVQATNDTDVAVNLRLTEAPKVGTVPTLNFGPPAGASVPVTMSGSGTNWNGTLTVTPAMGSGIGHFTLTVNDALDNVGHSITAGSALEIYNTALPSPPGQPVGFQVASLSGGRVQLNWLAVSNAEIYRVYSAAGTNLVAPTNLVADRVISNSYIDLPPADGFQRYVVSAWRRDAEGPSSIVRVALSDRTPPSAPTNAVLQLVAAGLQVGWQAGPGQAPDHYNIYRNGTLIRTVGAGTTTILDTPPRGAMSYAVGADDALGNEALSAPAAIELLVGAVDNLQALVNVGGAPMLSWVSSDPTVVAFNVYRNGIKQNAAPLAGTNFTDVLPPAGAVVTYAVRTLNATNAESAARTVDVYSVDLGLVMNQSGGSSHPPTGRYFDNYHVSLSNLTAAGALPLRQIEVRRTSTAGPFNLVSVAGSSVGVGDGLTRDLAVPCATDNSAQVVRLRAVQETDVGGSSVIYQRIFDFATVQAPGVMMEVSANTLPLAGGLNSFEVRVFNRGYTTMYLATARGNGADPGDLYILVRNPQGQEVSRQPFTGSPPGIIFSGGVGYVPLAPGASFRVTVPNVLVPEALASNLVTFEAVASAIYDRFSADGQQQSGPLNGAMQSSLAQTPYYGTAQTDHPLYSNDQPILITGQALDRLTGLPRTNVALKIGFATRGYRWYRDVTTDANGNYSYPYNPGPGLAGSLTIWAAHPDVVDQLNQAQINIYRIYATPAAGDIRMSKNDTLGFSISLLNPGDQALSHFTVGAQVYELQGTNQVPTTKVTGSLLSGANFSVAAGQRETINLQLAADADAPDNAWAVFTFTSGEGAAAVFTGNVALLAPVPIITVVNPDIGYVEVSLDRGKLLSRTVTIANRGLKDLKGVTLLPPTNQTWMVLNLPANPDGSIPLSDLDVGGSNSFTVVFAPPANTALGFHQDTILIRGTNAPGTFDVTLYARITSDQFGAVQFYVDNILGFDVPNATVRLRNTSLQLELPPAQTDINGLVTITNLQEGDWSWQVNAPGHSANVGVVPVTPSQTVQVATRLNKSVVTINFSVVPVPFTDRYEIRLEQTFETHVPMPVLVLTPSFMEFDNVTAGFEANYIGTAKNEGLIQMENLTITGSHSDAATFTPLITYVPVLLPQQSIEIPFHVTYSGTNAPSQQANPLVDCLPNPLGFMDDIVPFTEGLAALANAEGRCVRDNTLLMCAGAFAMGMRIIGDLTSVFAGVAEQAASYIGCVLGSLLSGFGGAGAGTAAANGQTGQQSVQNFVPTGNGCFAAETRVLLADGRFKTIAEIKPGDLVKTGPGRNDVAHVVETFERTTSKGREIQFIWPGRNRSDSLRTTDEHLFWEDGQGWVEAQKLKAGDWLLDDAARRVQVTESWRMDGPLHVFTFRLREDPAFYANGVLVHDLCGWWTPESPMATPTRGPPAPTPAPQQTVKMK